MPEYVFEQELIETTCWSRPDPDWHYVDRAGHAHDSRRELLVRVKDDPNESDSWFDADGEEWNASTHLECRLCGEHIEPRVIGDPYQTHIPGPVHFYRDGVEITEAEYRAGVGEL